MYDPTTNEVVDITNPYIQFSFDSMSSGDFPANGQHSYIHVFSFGLMLLELELGHQIAITAEDENDADEEYPPVYMALLRIFHSRKDDLDDPYIREVINSCLDFENRVEGIKHRAFSDHLRPRAALLRYIVQPLVNRLRAAHPDVSFDLINGPQQSIRAGFPHPASNHTGLSRAKVQHRTSTLQQFPGNSASLRMSSAQPHFIRSQSESGRQNALNKHATLVSNTVSVAGHALSASKKPKNDHPRSTEMAISLFDERTELISETDKSVRLASTFFDLFEKFRRHMQPAHGRCRVKIAVLDTGIDTAQCGLQLRREAIITDRETAEPSVNGDPVKATRSFIGPPDDTNDVCSHGTHIAEILLRLAPEADLYIAKISNYLHVDKVDQIAEAVNWALEHGCDIISMSFGMNPSLVPEASLFNVQNAIHRAATARKIMFAAASNCGGNGPRAYPASDPSVICTHAADGNGYDGGINPPKGDHADYFSTLGMAIGCIWDERCVYKSGTSFATPVAAAIAANVLDYAAYSVAAGKLTDQRYRELRQSQGMKKAFTKFLSVQMQHYRYVAPWHFWKTGVTDDYIWQRLKVDLTP
ncbi:peptidase S8 family protein [Metarhizium robertsii]|nr:peptidase S8 family protein [Metarhizium robertsii]